MRHIADSELHNYAERLKGKVVIITGGASGIGKEASLQFAAHGARVVIGDLNASAAESVVSEIKAAGGTAVSTRCNVVVWEDQLALFELAMLTYGAVDIVIPNAGVADYSYDMVQVGKDGKPVKPNLITMDVNLTGVLYTVHLTLHYMPLYKQEGDLKALLLIGSMASWMKIPSSTLYTGSKHAILGVMRSLSESFKFQDMRLATIHPWFADTNILPTRAKVILTGIPMLPVPRIAGCMIYAATNPDPKTSACAWLLPDDGPVFFVGKEDFKLGVYKMIDDRSNAIFKGAYGALYYFQCAKDLWRHTAPLRNMGLIAAAAAVTWSNRDKIEALVNQYLSQ